MVWRDLGSRRIRKSLEKKIGLGVTSRTEFLNGVYIVCTCIAEIKGMMSGHM